MNHDKGLGGKPAHRQEKSVEEVVNGDLPLVNEGDANMVLVESDSICPHCGTDNPVVTLGAKIDLHSYSDDEFYFYMFFSITNMPEQLMLAAQTINPKYGYYRDEYGDAYYQNACKTCGEVLNDENLQMEPGDAFNPFSAEDYERIKIIATDMCLEYEIRKDDDATYRDLIGLVADAWNPADDIWDLFVEGKAFP